MSIASPFGSESSALPDAQGLRTAALRPVQALAFWTAVLVPLAYPVLLYGGLDGQGLSTLAVAVLVNVLALLLGRGYNVDA